MSCREAGCAGEAAARGWCERHYKRWRRHGAPGGERGPKVQEHREELVYFNRRLKFTPALWARWWAAREPDAGTQARRRAIDEFRKTLEWRTASKLSS